MFHDPPRQLVGTHLLWPNGRAHRALGADVPRELARIHALDASDPVPLQVVLKGALRPPVAVGGAQLAHDQTGDPWARRLIILRRHPVVTDERGGHRHDLSCVGRIGQDFLIAGEARVEDDFAKGKFVVAARQTPAKYRPVLQDQEPLSPPLAVPFSLRDHECARVRGSRLSARR